MRTRMPIVGAIVIVALGSGTPAISDYYTLVPLPPGLSGSAGQTINSSGIVAGYVANFSQRRPAVWANDGHGLPGPNLGGLLGQYSGLNDLGRVVGFDDPDGRQHAFTGVIGGTAVDLHPLIPNNPDRSSAVDVNNAGQIAVYAGPNSGGGLPYLYDGSMMVQLPVPAASRYAGPKAINNRGQIVGFGERNGFEDGRALLWDQGQVIDLGTPPGRPYALANDINDLGDVVGYTHSAGSPPVRAALWADQQALELGTLPAPYVSSMAFGINNSRQVVGSAYQANGARHAFIWQAGTMTDLNALIAPGSGWELYDAWGINDSGWITGQARNPAGQLSGYLLIPEPATLWLVTLGMLVARRRLRARHAVS